jgi:hypothetical protein
VVITFGVLWDCTRIAVGVLLEGNSIDGVLETGI